MKLEIPQIIEAMKAAGLDADSILATVQELHKQGDEKRERKRMLTRERVKRHRGNITQCNASNALHDESSVTPPSSDGFPPHPLSLTPTPSKNTPKGVQKGSPTLPDWVPAEDWFAYVEMRKQIRKPMTARAMELAVERLDELRRHGDPPDKVLQKATLHSWQGLFPLDGKEKNKGKAKERGRITL